MDDNSLGCCDHDMVFKVLGGVGKENSRVKNFTQETVVWVPQEVALKGQLCQENVRSVRTAFFKQKSGPSHFCRELYQKILRKQVIQYLFAVLFKVSLHLKVSRVIDEAYVHIELYIYIHTRFSMYILYQLLYEQSESTFSWFHSTTNLFLSFLCYVLLSVVSEFKKYYILVSIFSYAYRINKPFC